MMMTPDNSLWISILLRDRQVRTMPDEKATALLLSRGFPKPLIEEYLRQRPTV